MLVTSCEKQIEAMTNGRSLLRIGDIWYGTNRWSTVSGIYHFSNKNVQTRQAIRAEAAISFSNSMPAIDTIQVELVVHYSAVYSHLQRLMAEILITPVLPVMNPVIAALTMPVSLNRDIYAAFGVPEEFLLPESDNPPPGMKIPSFRELMRIYSRVPVQMRIELAQVSTIDDASRDIRVILRLIRVHTANSYGEQPLYLRRLEDAVAQDSYLSDLIKGGGDNDQIVALASMLGIDGDQYKYMINTMQAVLDKTSLAAVPLGALETRVASGEEKSVDTGDGHTVYLTRNFPQSLVLNEDKSFDQTVLEGAEKDKGRTFYDPANPKTGQHLRRIPVMGIFNAPDDCILDILLCYACSASTPEVYFRGREDLDRYLAATPQSPLFRAITGSCKDGVVYRKNVYRSLPFRYYQKGGGRLIGYPHTSGTPLIDVSPSVLVTAYKTTLEASTYGKHSLSWEPTPDGTWSMDTMKGLSLRYVTMDFLKRLYASDSGNPFEDYAQYYRTTVLGE